MEEFVQLCGNGVPTAAPVRGDVRRVPSAVEDRANGQGERRWFAGGHEAPAGVAHNFGNAADIGCHHGTAACQSLQDNIRTTFHVTWQGDKIGCGHPDGDVVEGASRQCMDVAGGVVSIDGALNDWPVRPFTNQIDV